MSKKRPKNKQEMSSFSGKKKRPALKYKTRIDFSFKTEDQTVYKNGQGRIKITENGDPQYLIRVNDKWQTIKAELLTLKVVRYVKPRVVIQGKGSRRTAKR